jgi:hypothetical protein
MHRKGIITYDIAFSLVLQIVNANFYQQMLFQKMVSVKYELVSLACSNNRCKILHRSAEESSSREM